MKIRECSKKKYKQCLTKDVVLEISGAEKSDEFCVLSENTQKRLEELCKMDSDSVPVMEDAVKHLETALTNFCHKYSELEYNRFMQEILLSIKTVSDDSIVFYAFFLYLHPLIVEWYSSGMQASGNSKVHVSLCGSMDITLLELDIISFSTMQLIEKMDYISDREVKAIVSGFKVLNGEGKYHAL